MNASYSLYLHKLKSAGYSNTATRLAVFKLLQKREHEPLSMSELVLHMKPHADRASAYRSVKLFEKLGIIKRLNIGWKYKLELSDDFQGHHYHITCTGCNKTMAVDENADLEKLLHSLATRVEFKLTDHQIDIHGLCNKCDNINKSTK